MCQPSLFSHRCPSAWVACCTWWTCHCPPPPCTPLLRSPGTVPPRSVPQLTATVRRWWRVQETPTSSSPQSTFMRRRTILLHLPAVKRPDGQTTLHLLLSQWWFCLHDNKLDWRFAFLLFATYYLPRVHTWPSCLLNICILYIYTCTYMNNWVVWILSNEMLRGSKFIFFSSFTFQAISKCLIMASDLFCSAAILSFLQ